MTHTIADTANRVEGDTCQAQTGLCIVRGPHRLRFDDRLAAYDCMHALALQGWAGVRIGRDVYVFWADVEEGRA